MLHHRWLADIALWVALSIRVGTPDDEAETLDVVAILAAMQSNQLVSRGNLEVLPTLSLLVRVGVAAADPEVVHKHITSLIYKTQSLYVPTAVILVDVDVGEAA